MLLLLSRQLVEVSDHTVCLGVRALMSGEGLQQIACPPVMQEKDPLTKAPKRRRPEFVTGGGALNHTVGEALSHFMQSKIREGMVLSPAWSGFGERPGSRLPNINGSFRGYSSHRFGCPAWTADVRNLSQAVRESRRDKVLSQLVREIDGEHLPRVAAELPWGHNMVLIFKLQDPVQAPGMPAYAFWRHRLSTNSRRQVLRSTNNRT